MDLPPATAPDFLSPAPLADAAALLEALPWGVLALDAQGVIQRINQQAAAWCGVAAEAVLGRPLAQASLPAALGAALRQLPPEGAALCEVWLPGPQQWLSLRAAPAPAGQRWVFLEDTTVRHQAEAAQQRSSQLLLDMEEVARTGSYEADLASGSFYFSDGLYRLFGEAPQAFEGTLAAIDARSHPDDAATVRQVLDEAIRDKQPYTYRRRIRRPNGQWRTLEAHGEVRCDAAGHPVQLRGLVQDITERVQAEQALHAGHELLQRTIDSSLDLVQVFEAVRDEQGAVVDFTWVLNNAAAERMYGNVVGQRLCELNPGVVEEGIFDTFRQVLETGVPDQRERHYAHEQFDGWFYQLTVKLGDGVTTTTHDISARKRAEQALRESKTLLQDIIDAPHIGLAVYRAVRNAAGDVIDFTHEYINRASREMLGEDFTGRLFTDHGENALVQLPQFMEALSTGRRNSYLREADFRGQRVWFAITNTPLDGDRLVHTWEDVTERQQAEAEIIRLQEEIAQQATDKYQVLFNSIDEGYSLIELLYDEGGRVIDFLHLEVNPTAERLNGFEHMAGQRIRELLPDVEAYWLELYEGVAATGEPVRAEHHVAAQNRWFSVYASRVGGAGSRLIAAVFDDITARKQHEQRQQFLLQLNDALCPLAAPLAIQREALRVLRAHLGGTRTLYAEALDQAGTMYISTENRDPGLVPMEGLVMRFQDFTPDGLAEAQAGRPLWRSDVLDEAPTPEQRAGYATFGTRAWLMVPLVKNGRLVADLTVHSATARAWTAHDIALVQETTERTWAAVERARAEEALAASEQRLRTLIASLPGAAAFVVGPDLRYQLAGGEALNAAGLGPADLLGRTVAEAMPPELVAPYEAHYRQALAGQDFSLEHTAHGRTFISRGVPLLDAAGQPESVLVVSYDITARKQAEEALRLSEEKFRTLANTAPALIWFNNERGENQFVNQYFLDYIGHTPENVRGLAWRTLIHPDDAPTYLASYQQAVREQCRWQNRSRVRRYDGAWHWFEHYAKPLFDDEGRFLGHVGVSADVTAIVQAQEALLVSETKYRTLFETMDQGFGIGQVLPANVAAGTPLDWQWLEVNPPLERLTGLPRADVLAQTTRRLIPGLEEVWYERYALAATGETVNFEAFSPVLDRWFDVYAFALGPPDNRRVGVLFSNASEQKQVEAALREAEARHLQQLEQQVRERTQQLQASRDLLQSVLDTSLISMSVLQAERDEAGQVLDFRLALVNKELERETGRSDLVGKRHAQEYPGIRQVGIFDLMLRALATDEPQGMEYFYDYEGFSRWYACQFVRLGDGLVATNLDITERKTAEQERLKNLRLLEQAEAVAGLGSWDYDLATGAMRWSEGMYHLVHLPLGQPVSPEVYLQLVADDDRPRAERLVRQLTSGQGVEETLRLRVGEHLKTVRLKAVVLRDEAGQPARVLGVDLDISELQRLEQENLRLRLGQQQALFEAVQAAQEAERKRIAEGLHNGIGQILYATKLQLDRLPDEADSSPRHRAAALLGEAIRQTRALSHELTPAILEEFGLEATLRSMCNTLSTPALRWHCHLVVDEGPALPPALQLAVYRLAQELAQNVLKHAHATTATLEVEVLPAWVVLRIEDNGRGFDPAQTSDGLGLRTLRSRAALLGGSVQLATAPGQGTQCQVRLPLPTPSV